MIAAVGRAEGDRCGWQIRALQEEEAAGKYRFRLKAGNGEFIAVGEAYESKGGAENGIESVRRNAPEAGTRRPNGVADDRGCLGAHRRLQPVRVAAPVSARPHRGGPTVPLGAPIRLLVCLGGK